ncbi:M23 family peptidase, partial [Streptomyces sp. SID8455]|nr:M23 family peptidase [Streptomyces sp. SID8455]
TGNSTGPHLHFEARTTPEYGSDMDPVGYLRSHGLNV